MKKQTNTQQFDIKDINKNIMECWQLIKLANERKKQEKETRSIKTNKK